MRKLVKWLTDKLPAGAPAGVMGANRSFRSSWCAVPQMQWWKRQWMERAFSGGGATKSSRATASSP